MIKMKLLPNSENLFSVSDCVFLGLKGFLELDF
jgi:hypothetical protein